MITIPIQPIEVPADCVIIGGNIYSKQVQGLDIPENHNFIKADYAFVPTKRSERSLEFDAFISLVQDCNGLSWDGTHNALRDWREPNAMSSIDIFMRHYNNVNAVCSGQIGLYDISGRLVEGERLQRVEHGLNYNHYIWLNAMFIPEEKKDTGFLGLDLVRCVGFNEDDSPKYVREPLEECLCSSGGVAELDSLNKQGLPTKKSVVFERGKTIYFWLPSKGCVAGFGADSGRVYLSCSGDPTYSDPELGVCRAKILN